jgi:mevalonate kinase
LGQELILSIPGKTFLAGEYLAITGGASFVISTYKCFEMHVKQGGTSTWKPHPQSPAGRLLSRHADFFQGLDLNFKNPYQVGGFGASTAEFISLQALLQFGNSLWIEQERFFDLQEFLKSYRENSEISGSWVPSGADLVGQIQGGVSYFERNSGKLQKFAWPFHQLGFVLLSTGLKLQTHEHLQNLKQFETTRMMESLVQIHEAFKNIDEKQLLLGLEILLEF